MKNQHLSTVHVNIHCFCNLLFISYYIFEELSPPGEWAPLWLQLSVGYHRIRLDPKGQKIGCEFVHDHLGEVQAPRTARSRTSNPGCPRELLFGNVVVTKVVREDENRYLKLFPDVHDHMTIWARSSHLRLQGLGPDQGESQDLYISATTPLGDWLPLRLEPSVGYHRIPLDPRCGK